VVLGTMGAGKSTTGNILLGKKVFPENDRPVQARPIVQQDTSDMNGWIVVDTPGLGQPDGVDVVMTAITDYLYEHHCVIVYVLNELRHELSLVSKHMNVLGRLLTTCDAVLVVRCPIAYVSPHELSNEKMAQLATFVREQGVSANAMAHPLVKFPVVCTVTASDFVHASSPAHPQRLLTTVRRACESSFRVLPPRQALRWRDLQNGQFDLALYKKESARVRKELQQAKKTRQMQRVGRGMNKAAATSVAVVGTAIAFTVDVSAAPFTFTFGGITSAGAATSVIAGQAMGHAVEKVCTGFADVDPVTKKDIQECEEEAERVDRQISDAQNVVELKRVIESLLD
jgi:predicted GTPase